MQTRLFFTTTEEAVSLDKAFRVKGSSSLQLWDRMIIRVVGSLGEFVLCDLALSLGRSQRHVYFLRGRHIEHRTSCDLLFQCLQGPLDRKLTRI